MSFINIKTPEQVEAERIEKASSVARSKRNSLIQEVEYIMAPDYPMADKTAYIDYRQLLRDVPQQAGFPDSIVWPTKPA